MAIEIIQHNENCFEKKEAQTVIKLTLEELIEAKVKEIKLQCGNKIEAGFDSDIHYGDIRHYTLNQQEQLDLKEFRNSILIENDSVVPFKDKNTIVCDIWSAEDFLKFYKEAKDFVQIQRFKSDVLELWIRTESLTYEEIEVINMDSILPQKYIEVLKERLAQVGVAYDNTI